MMQELFDYLSTKLNIDIIIVVIVLLAGFFQGFFMSSFVWNKTPKTDTAWKVLAVSLVVSLAYLFLRHRGSKEPIDWAKYLISYFAATSLYEILISPFRNWIIQKFNLGQNNPS